MPTDRLSYEVVDVFTSHPFAGNPLAVVYGGDDLSTDQMRAIASEFNLSETTFPVSPTDADRAAGADYRVRIFTPAGEIPFAGHPTLGTAWSLRQRRLIAPGDRVQACGAGPIAVRLPADPAGAVELSATPRDHAQRLWRDEVHAVAELIGLTANDVVGQVVVAGCGLSFVHLPISAASVGRARPAARPLSELGLDRLRLLDPLEGVNAYAVVGDKGAVRVNCRVFVPGLAVPEDPATGSAAAALGIALVSSGGAAADGETHYRINQGVDMGRPSVLHGRVEASAGQAVLCHVAGQVVPVASGSIVVPS